MGRGFFQHPGLCAPLLFSHLSCPSPTSRHTPVPSGLHSVPQLCHGFLPLSLGTVCLSCLRHMPSSNRFAKLTPTPVSSLTSHISSWQQLFYEPLQYAGSPDRGPPPNVYFPFNDVYDNHYDYNYHWHVLIIVWEPTYSINTNTFWGRYLIKSQRYWLSW